MKEWASTNFNLFLAIKFHWNFLHYKNPALNKKRYTKIKNSIKQQLVGNQTFELINKILKSKSVHLIKILRQRNFLHKQDKIRQDLLLTHCLLSDRMEKNFLKIQTTNVCNPWSVKIAIFTTLKNTIFLKANFSIIELFAK